MYANVNQFSSTNDLSISIMLRCVIFVQSNMYPYKWIDHTLYHISLFLGTKVKYFTSSEIFHFFLKKVKKRRLYVLFSQFRMPPLQHWR